MSKWRSESCCGKRDQRKKHRPLKRADQKKHWGSRAASPVFAFKLWGKRALKMCRKALLLVSAPDQKIHWHTRNYTKSFRGWGRGGGDPFAKGSLPHKAFNQHLARRPVRQTFSFGGRYFVNRIRATISRSSVPLLSMPCTSPSLQTVTSPALTCTDVPLSL